MSIQAHLAELEKKHQALETELADALAHPSVDDATIAATLGIPDRAACAARLIELALAAGGRDNVSAVVADVAPRRDAATAW